jgi:hypothetical protein
LERFDEEAFTGCALRLELLRPDEREVFLLEEDFERVVGMAE